MIMGDTGLLRYIDSREEVPFLIPGLLSTRVGVLHMEENILLRMAADIW
jgi:hypothetical protein